MQIFALDSETLTAHTDSLRADAAGLEPLPVTPVPSGYPFTAFYEAYMSATEAADQRGKEVAREAYRVARCMEATWEAANNVDANTGKCLGGLL